MTSIDQYMTLFVDQCDNLNIIPYIRYGNKLVYVIECWSVINIFNVPLVAVVVVSHQSSGVKPGIAQ